MTENASLLSKSANGKGFELVKSYNAADESTGSKTCKVDSVDSLLDCRKCSVFETSCNLISVTMGSGILSLPYAASSMGWSALIILAALGIILTYGFDLLAKSMNKLALKLNLRPDTLTVDYIVMGKYTLGKHGETAVMAIFATELLLALMSLLMTIAINMQVVVAGKVSFFGCIVIAAIFNIFLSSLELKLAAYSSAVGTAMTILTVLAIIGSGIEEEQLDIAGTNMSHEYKFLDMSGLSMAAGLVAFCYGGHSTFPKLYTSMKEPRRYREVIVSMLLVVLLLYMLVMGLGYYFYAQYTLAPVTLNIGRDLTGTHFLPHGKALRLLAAVGVVCNLSVSCPLVTLPLRDAVLRLFCAGGEDIYDHQNHIVVSDRESLIDDSLVQNGVKSGNVLVNNRQSYESVDDHNKESESHGIGSNNSHLLQFLASFLVTSTASILAVCLQDHFAAACSLVGAIASFTDSIILPLVFYHRLHPECSRRLWIMHMIMLLISLVTFGGGLVGMLCEKIPEIC